MSVNQIKDPLLIVFSFLSMSELRKARLPCKLWNEKAMQTSNLALKKMKESKEVNQMIAEIAKFNEITSPFVKENRILNSLFTKASINLIENNIRKSLIGVYPHISLICIDITYETVEDIEIDIFSTTLKMSAVFQILLNLQLGTLHYSDLVNYAKGFSSQDIGKKMKQIEKKCGKKLQSYVPLLKKHIEDNLGQKSPSRFYFPICRSQKISFDCC